MNKLQVLKRECFNKPLTKTVTNQSIKNYKILRIGEFYSDVVYILFEFSDSYAIFDSHINYEFIKDIDIVSSFFDHSTLEYRVYITEKGQRLIEEDVLNRDKVLKYMEAYKQYLIDNRKEEIKKQISERAEQIKELSQQL